MTLFCPDEERRAVERGRLREDRRRRQSESDHEEFSCFNEEEICLLASPPYAEVILFCVYSQCLYEAGVKRKGTDVLTWINIMSQRSVPHLQKGELHRTDTRSCTTPMFRFAVCLRFHQTSLRFLVLRLSVFDRYKSYSPYDMKESIRKEVKGDLEKSFLTLGNTAHRHHHHKTTSSPHVVRVVLMCLCVVVTVECFENKQLYFANRLSEAMKVTLPVDSRGKYWTQRLHCPVPLPLKIQRPGHEPR